MKKKILIIIIVTIFIISFLVYGFLEANNIEGKYTLNLINKTKTIEIIKNDIVIEINDKKKINKIYNILKELNTNKESYYESPLNASNLIKITFKGRKDKKDIYLYIKDNKYYIEQPYNGVYEIDEEKYNKIKEYLNEG